MLRKVLIATVGIGATLLAVATVLPVQPQPGTPASASAAAPKTQTLADDRSTRQAERGRDRGQADDADHDDRRDDERRSRAAGKHGEKREHKSRD